ncbi:hypothetical protein chiPu_0001335 [Chiloscyllium punctatum]|uniref:Uncharacterized protein n=1 Tax=Chiloscyllium punctatum TaxID=137246 RepID=A0A401RXQ3_CHIPU|nr:hypothetical protein [Chiloscyllium punctatum]
MGGAALSGWRKLSLSALQLRGARNVIACLHSAGPCKKKARASPQAPAELRFLSIGPTIPVIIEIVHNAEFKIFSHQDDENVVSLCDNSQRKRFQKQDQTSVLLCMV